MMLIGICVLLISLAFTKAYNPKIISHSSIGKIGKKGEIVLSDGQLVIPNYKKVGETSSGYNLVEPDMSTAYYEGRFAVPHMVLPFFGVVPIFVSLGIFLFFLKSKEEKEKLKAQKRKEAEEKQQRELKEREEINRRLADEKKKKDKELRKQVEIEKRKITLINCLICGNAISVNASTCPKCGEPLTEENKSKAIEKILSEVVNQNYEDEEKYIRTVKQSSREKSFVSPFALSCLVVSFIGYWTPVIYVNFFVALALILGIMSLARKENLKVLAIIGILLSVYCFYSANKQMNDVRSKVNETQQELERLQEKLR